MTTDPLIPIDDGMPEDEIARFVAGKCTAEEGARVRAWIGGADERRRYVESLARTWQLGALPLNRWDTDRGWDDLMTRRGRAPARQGDLTEPGRRPLEIGVGAARLRWPLQVAAALILLVGGALLWRTTPRNRHEVATSSLPIHEYATRPGQRAELRLADGTRVLLSVDSRIRVPVDFGPGGRTVSLEGEAFFDVRHDPEHPFRVRTASGTAQDLGTEFVVSAYPESRAMRVAVVSGIVGLERAPAAGVRTGAALPPVRLTRGDLALLDSARTDVRHDVDLAPYVGWTTGSLVFEGVPLGATLPRLERWYDVEIHLADPALADRRLTATFRDAPLAHVLDLLALSFHLRVEQHGRTILLAPERGTRAR